MEGGINVQASWAYTASFYHRVAAGSTLRGTFTISLKSVTTGETFASVPVHAESSEHWTQISVKLHPNATAPDTNNVFEVTVDGTAAAGKSIYFALFSLFPPTFKDRENGMRLDIATVSQ